jgi:NADPH:quinone reductase-like Zn-dependent oxidoreductase
MGKPEMRLIPCQFKIPKAMWMFRKKAETLAARLMVEVRAISVNPEDIKNCAGGGPGRPGGQLPILGWNAAGTVKEILNGQTNLGREPVFHNYVWKRLRFYSRLIKTEAIA